MASSFLQGITPVMKVLACILIVLPGASACGLSSQTGGRVLAAHHFDLSDEGWRIAGDTGVIEPAFSPDGGDPGGHISADDDPIGETWYFRAPPDVRQLLPGAWHGTIRYSLRQSAIDAGFLEDDIVIEGPAGRLSYRFRSAPGIDWTDFSVELSAAAGWRWNWNAPATDDQIQGVLADVTRLDIRGEYRTGPDVGALDNFVLTSGE